MRNFIVFCFVFYTTLIFAQDVIVKKDGSTILAKVLEIGTSDMKYKKYSNPNGPTYTIYISDVMAVNYENGEKDSFANTKEIQPTKEDYIQMASPDVYNEELINRYNQIYEHGDGIDDKSKIVKEGIFFMGVGKGSVLSTNEVTIEFVQEPYKKEDYWYNLINRFYIRIHNKTDRTIYIDLGNTFRVTSDGNSKVYYDASQTTITQGGGRGASINLGSIAGAVGIGGALGTIAGGINVGGANTASASKTYTKQRILAIPPYGKVPLEKYKDAKVRGNKYEVIFEDEPLTFEFKKGKCPVTTNGGKYVYNEDNSPFRTQYIITYSNDELFKEVKVLKASVFINEMIGCTESLQKYTRDKTDDDKVMKAVKKWIPDYNDYSIIGEYWEEE